MKLVNFPHIIWINLDICQDRASHMQNILHNLPNTRFSACDPLTSLKYITPHPKISPGENACTTSHLMALRMFLDSGMEEVIIMEDDIDFMFLKYIPYDWSEFKDQLPQKWQLVQLAVTSHGKISPLLVSLTKNPRFCSAAYLINRSGAQYILDIFGKDDKYDLNNHSYPTADKILQIPESYSIPLITTLTTDSCIHDTHLAFHRRSKLAQLLMWQKTVSVNNR
jgi:GR25 family glycosyltransferase involved in LPS biosynthesis